MSQFLDLLCMYFDHTAFRGVSGRVPHHIFDRATQESRIAQYRKFVHNLGLDLTIARLSFKVRVLCNLLNYLFQLHWNFPCPGPALESRNRCEAADQLVHTVGFQTDAVKNTLRFRSGALASQFKCHRQPGERRAQLV